MEGREWKAGHRVNQDSRGRVVSMGVKGQKTV